MLGYLLGYIDRLGYTRTWVHTACSDSCEHEVGWPYAGPSWWNLDRWQQVLRDCPSWRCLMEWGCGALADKRAELGCGTSHSSCAQSSSKIPCWERSEPHRHVCICQLAEEWWHLSQQSLTLWPWASHLFLHELQISPVNQAAILNMPVG